MLTIDDTYGHERFYAAIKKMAELHANKNRDYGNGNPLGNFMTAEQLGIDPFDGVLVRMSDKWTRICSLRRSGQQYVKDESIEDTLLDLANYCLLALVIKAEVDGKNVEDDPSLGGLQCDGTCANCTCQDDNDIEIIPDGKSFTCLQCTQVGADVHDAQYNCYHCIHAEKNVSGIDYFVDERLVKSLAGKGVTGNTDEYCAGNIHFCNCEKCKKARFLNAM